MPLLLVALAVPFDQWPQFGADPENSHLQPTGSVIVTPVVEWSYTGAYGDFYFNMVRDVNGDGIPDVVGVGEGSSNVVCLRGTDGAFQWQTSFGGDPETGVVLEDVTGDGIIDVVVPVDFSTGDDTVYCLRGTDGAVQWAASDGNHYVSRWNLPTALDVDNDGAIEVLHEGFPTYSINGVTGAIEWAYSSAGAYRAGPAASDVTGDGVPDVIMSKGLSLRCLRGTNGTVQWTAPVSEIFFTAAVGDVTGDGNPDVVAGGSSSGNVHCFAGINGAVQWTFNDASADFSTDPALGDVTGDGITDVLIANTGSSLLYCLRGTDGVQQWTVNVGNGFFAYPGQLALADIDNDGYPEVIASGRLSAMYAIDGDGSVLWQNSSWDGSPALADVDGDTCLEIVAQTNSNTVVVIGDDGSCNPTGIRVGEDGADSRSGLAYTGGSLLLTLPSGGAVRLSLYDAAGKRAAVLHDGELQGGAHRFGLPALPRGVYIALAETPARTLTAKLVR